MTELTVLLIHFNDSRIFKTIDVLNATSFRSKIHLHVQDGGSAEEMVSEIKSSLLNNDTIVCEKDSGIFDGINRAMRHVKSPYFTWIGCDDIIDESYNWGEVSELFANSNVACVQSKVEYFKNNKITRICRAHDNSFLLYSLGVPFYHFGSTWDSKILLHNIQFDMKYRVAADFGFFYKLFKLGYRSNALDSSIVYLGDGGNSSANIGARINGYRDIFKQYGIKIFFPIFMLVRLFFKLSTKYGHRNIVSKN